jgi:transposase
LLLGWSATHAHGGVLNRLWDRHQKYHDCQADFQQAGNPKDTTIIDGAPVLAVESALWTFLYEEGVEPTNNHAERMVRRGVVWRKCAYGSWSGEGCRFVERMLTVMQTLRLQQRPVLHYRVAAVQAHRDNLPMPSLLSNQ